MPAGGVGYTYLVLSRACLSTGLQRIAEHADRPWEALTIKLSAAGRGAALSRVPGLCYSDAVNEAKNWMEGHQRSGYRGPKGLAHTLSHKSRLERLTALWVKWHVSGPTFQAFMKDTIAP